MYGKHFTSMYEGSMIGSGAMAFAVWGYIISHMRPDKTVGFQVELNPVLIAFKLGEKENDVAKTIAMFCEPDPRSRTQDEEGRKLIKIGVYDYKVVNGAKYDAIKNEENRREQNRINQQNRRDKLASMTPEERKAYEEGIKKARKKHGKKGLKAANLQGHQQGVDQIIKDNLAAFNAQ